MKIDMIEVSENNKYFVIYPEKKEVIINGNSCRIETEEVEELIRIIRTWKPMYGDSSYTDGNKFEVVVLSNGKIDVMKGYRDVPDNYESFSDFVRRIYDRR